MATSGSYDWTRTAVQIIGDALELVGVVSPGGTPTPAQTLSARATLNGIVKELQNSHIFPWSRDWETKAFAASSEVIGTDGLNYRCFLAHTSAADNKPITGANYTTYWTQDGSSGSGWTTSTSYTSKGDFLLGADTIGIEAAFVRDGGNDYPVKVVGLREYMEEVSEKWREGRPFLMVYDVQLAPRVYLYYQPDDVTIILHYLRTRMLEDFDANSNTPDMRTNWIRPLTWELAVAESFKYGLPIAERDALRKEADRLVARAKRFGREQNSGDFILPAFYE